MAEEIAGDLKEQKRVTEQSNFAVSRRFRGKQIRRFELFRTKLDNFIHWNTPGG